MEDKEQKINPRLEEGNITKKIRENPWILSTFVVGIICLMFIIGNFESIPYIENNDLDNFSQCLTDKGLTMYGTEWCGYCKQQKELFSNSFAKINYIDCDLDKTACINAGIEGYPTWKLGNQSYQGVHTIEKLSKISGCNLE